MLIYSNQNVSNKLLSMLKKRKEKKKAINESTDWHTNKIWSEQRQLNINIKLWCEYTVCEVTQSQTQKYFIDLLYWNGLCYSCPHSNVLENTSKENK